MIYQPKHISSRPDGAGSVFLKRASVLLPILLCILILNISDSAREFAAKIVSPLAGAGNYLYNFTSAFTKGFGDKSKLMEENKLLSAEIENLRLNAVNGEIVRLENEWLRTELGLKPAGNFVAGRIVARPPQIPLDSLFIDRGTTDNLTDRDFVLASDKVLIGRIAKVNKNTAIVAQSSFPGEVSFGFLERTNEPIEIKGSGGGSMQAKVPINFDIAVDDKIMVADSNIYLAALVSVIEENRSSGFKDVLLSLPVNISKIRVVFIEPFINE